MEGEPWCPDLQPAVLSTPHFHQLGIRPPLQSSVSPVATSSVGNGMAWGSSQNAKGDMTRVAQERREHCGQSAYEQNRVKVALFLRGEFGKWVDLSSWRGTTSHRTGSCEHLLKGVRCGGDGERPHYDSKADPKSTMKGWLGLWGKGWNLCCC